MTTLEQAKLYAEKFKQGNDTSELEIKHFALCDALIEAFGVIEKFSDHEFYWKIQPPAPDKPGLLKSTHELREHATAYLTKHGVGKHEL